MEKIICSAVWYKDFPIKLIIDSSLVRPINCDCGIVFSGHRHAQCIYQQVSITGKKQCDAGIEIQGFLTSKNRFVDRIEAGKIALSNGQITELKFDEYEMFSEDLY